MAIRWPKISIVTPSYNQGQFLEETILSVLNQDYQNLEYIIIDGGSTDNSVEIIEKYVNKLTYWVSEPDKGQSDAINKGFSKASGEILAWINSDDIYYPDVLREIGQYFFRHPEADFVFGYHDDIDYKGQIIRRGVYFPFVRWGFIRGFPQICQPTSFWRKGVWDRCGPLDFMLNYDMDYNFFYNVIKEKFNIRSIPIRACAFRYHESSKTNIRESESGDLISMQIRYRYFPENGALSILFSKIVVIILRSSRRLLRILGTLG